MNAALSVPCKHCGAPVNRRCTALGTDGPLRWQSAHPSRLDDAGLPPQHEQAVARYREAITEKTN